MSVRADSWPAVDAGAVDQSMTNALLASFAANTHPLPQDLSVNMAELCEEMTKHMTHVLAKEQLKPARVEKVNKDEGRTYVVLQSSGAKAKPPNVELLQDKLEIDLSKLARRKPLCPPAKPNTKMSTYEAEAWLARQREEAAAPALFECEHQCGFQGAYPVVVKHEETCPRRIDLLKLRNQVHFYLSDENLCNDWFFYNQVLASEEGWIDVKVIAQCPRVRQMGAGVPAILTALQSSTELETFVSAAGAYVRRRCPPPFWHASHAVLADGVQQDALAAEQPAGGGFRPPERPVERCAPFAQSAPPASADEVQEAACAALNRSRLSSEASVGSSRSKPTENLAEPKTVVPGVGPKRTSKPILTSFASLKSGPGKLREMKRKTPPPDQDKPRMEEASTTAATSVGSPRSKASSHDDTNSNSAPPTEEHV